MTISKQSITHYSKGDVFY